MRGEHRTRLAWLDAARGIGIILVVAGHAFRDDMRAESAVCEWVYQLIYSFHMPFFFLLAGMAFSISLKSSADQGNVWYLKRRIKRLLVPFLSYSLLIYLLFRIAAGIPWVHAMLLGAGYADMGLAEYLGRCFTLDNPYAFHLWFIWLLFLMEGICWMLFRARGESAAALAVGLILLCWALAALDLPPLRPIWTFFHYLPSFCAGILLMQFLPVWRGKAWVAAAASVCGWAFLLGYVQFQSRILTVWRPWGLEIALFLAAVLVSISLLRLSMRLEQSRILCRLGQNSFGIYLFHQPLFCGFLGQLLYGVLHVPAAAVYLVCFGSSFAAPGILLHGAGKWKPLQKFLNLVFHVS